MTTPMNTELATRLTALEQENRRLRRWGGASLCLVAAFAVMGQAVPKEEKVPEVVQAKAFEVVTDAGFVAARMSLMDPKFDRSPATLTFSRGKAKGQSLLGPDGLVLAKDERVRIRVGTRIGVPDEYDVAVVDHAAVRGVVIKNHSVVVDGGSVRVRGGAVEVTGKTGLGRAVLGSALIVKDQDATQTAAGSLTLFDSSGKTVFKVPE